MVAKQSGSSRGSVTSWVNSHDSEMVQLYRDMPNINLYSSTVTWTLVELWHWRMCMFFHPEHLHFGEFSRQLLFGSIQTSADQFTGKVSESRNFEELFGENSRFIIFANTLFVKVNYFMTKQNTWTFLLWSNLQSNCVEASLNRINFSQP